jgi:hypothetical protein
MVSLILGLIGLLAIAAFSILAARSEEAMWNKCGRRESAREMQRQISVGKSRIR